MTKLDSNPQSTSHLAGLLEFVQSSKLTDMPYAERVEKLVGLGNETFQFVTERLKLGMHPQNAILHAKGVAEIQHIQAQFFQKAIDDYTAEAAKLMEMGKSIATQSGINPAILE